MAFKKHDWLDYGKKGEIVEITIRDSSGTKVDFFRCNNQKSYAEIISTIEKSYGYRPYYKKKTEEKKEEVEEEVKFLEEERKKVLTSNI